MFILGKDNKLKISKKQLKERKENFYKEELIKLVNNRILFSNRGYRQAFPILVTIFQIIGGTTALILSPLNIVATSFLAPLVVIGFGAIRIFTLDDIEHCYKEYYANKKVQMLFKYKIFFYLDVYLWPRLLQVKYKWHNLITSGNTRITNLRVAKDKGTFLRFVELSIKEELKASQNDLEAKLIKLKDIKNRHKNKDSELSKMLIQDVNGLEVELTKDIENLIKCNFEINSKFQKVYQDLRIIVNDLTDMDDWVVIQSSIRSSKRAKELIAKAEQCMQQDLETLMNSQNELAGIISEITNRTKAIEELDKVKT